ncbi:putative glycolipid-binding domain-containing protein [Agrococcus sediminis]|uniref:putative glycolipid-binding domain-containing protein n=1 Tax=Agrococcus sediminis TaxID=2599924 RepID=UPI001CED5D96|nr:putative glycolipid-binding domain-containing protein [Agrococcus sediminis]
MLPRGILRIPCRSSAAAHGTSTCDEYSAAWSLEVGEGWITRRLDVAVRAQGWSRDLSLRRDDAARWSAEARAAGTVALPAPGLSADVDLDAAVDCDLGLCPVTNTMPIRRLGLLGPPVAEAELVMAWVEVPSLRVLRSGQRYGSHDAGRVRYASGDRGFQAELVVDEDGLVVDYPGLARRVDEEAAPGR